MFEGERWELIAGDIDVPALVLVGELLPAAKQHVPTEDNYDRRLGCSGGMGDTVARVAFIGARLGCDGLAWR